MPRYSFTQPICNGCYDVRYPGREPSRLVAPSLETCCDCGERTTDGVYLRVDPNTVPHPTRLKDD